MSEGTENGNTGTPRGKSQSDKTFNILLAGTLVALVVVICAIAAAPKDSTTGGSSLGGGTTGAGWGTTSGTTGTDGQSDRTNSTDMHVTTDDTSSSSGSETGSGTGSQGGQSSNQSSSNGSSSSSGSGSTSGGQSTDSSSEKQAEADAKSEKKQAILDKIHEFEERRDGILPSFENDPRGGGSTQEMKEMCSDEFVATETLAGEVESWLTGELGVDPSVTRSLRDERDRKWQAKCDEINAEIGDGTLAPLYRISANQELMSDLITQFLDIAYEKAK